MLQNIYIHSTEEMQESRSPFQDGVKDCKVHKSTVHYVDINKASFEVLDPHWHKDWRLLECVEEIHLKPHI